VLVDYQYLLIALSLLIEVVISEDKNVNQLSLKAVQDGEIWRLQISDLNAFLITILQQSFKRANGITKAMEHIRPENVLKLMIACRILYLQNIKLSLQGPEENPDLYLVIPALVDHKAK
jgi:hypothetical protein